MQSIADKVFIEDSFSGVTLGAISTSRGLVHIDAPPSPDDSRAWRASLMNVGAGPERLLINLDTHPDRTLGARAMDCIVIAHEKTAHAFRTRTRSSRPALACPEPSRRRGARPRPLESAIVFLTLACVRNPLRHGPTVWTT